MILSLLISIVLTRSSTTEQDWVFPPVFLCESIALILFGTAWLIKGKVEELLLKPQEAS